MLVVEKDTKEILIPALKSVIKEINFAKDKVFVNHPWVYWTKGEIRCDIRVFIIFLKCLKGPLPPVYCKRLERKGF